MRGERRLHRGVLVEIVDDNLGIAVPLQFDDDAGVFVRFVTNRADIRQDLAVHQIGDALDQGGAIDVVRNLGDDDLFASTFDFFDTGFAADFHASATRLEVLANAAHAA